MSAIAFHNLSIFIGVTRVPVREFSFKYSEDMELVYVNEKEPVGIADGVMRYEGSMKMLLRDALRLEAAAPNQIITRLKFDATGSINTGQGFVTKTLKTCRIKEFDFSGSKEDMNLEVTLPVLFTGIITK